MNLSNTTHRRGFLSRVFGTTAAAAGASIVGGGTAAAQESSADAWLKEVKGTHRCLFDFPQHKNGFPLLHILNYLNTYNAAYKTTPGQVGAVGTVYALGTESSISLAFHDARGVNYQRGDSLRFRGGAGRSGT